MPSLWEPMTLEEALARIEELETIETANKTAIAGKQRKARPRGAVGRANRGATPDCGLRYLKPRLLAAEYSALF